MRKKIVLLMCVISLLAIGCEKRNKEVQNNKNNNNVVNPADKVPPIDEDKVKTKIEVDDITMPEKFDYTSNEKKWSDLTLLNNFKEFENGNIIGYTVDENCVEIYMKDIEYTSIQSYSNYLETEKGFGKVREDELIKTGNYYILKRINESTLTKFWLFYFNDTKTARLLVFKLGYFTVGGLSDEEIQGDK